MGLIENRLSRVFFVVMISLFIGFQAYSMESGQPRRCKSTGLGDPSDKSLEEKLTQANKRLELRRSHSVYELLSLRFTLYTYREREEQLKEPKQKKCFEDFEEKIKGRLDHRFSEERDEFSCLKEQRNK